MNVDNIPQIIQEAFFLTTSGQRGPDLVDIPKDIQQQMAIPLWYNSCSRDQTNQRGRGNTAPFSFAVVILSH
jgi:thiamine pyrophosphate-dependent acetolactate synthase large subunit-like protein